jgi:hypothetical protein
VFLIEQKPFLELKERERERKELEAGGNSIMRTFVIIQDGDLEFEPHIHT